MDLDPCADCGLLNCGFVNNGGLISFCESVTTEGVTDGVSACTCACACASDGI